MPAFQLFNQLQHQHTIVCPHNNTYTHRWRILSLNVVMKMSVYKGFLLEHVSHPKVIMPTNNSTVVSSTTVETNELSTILEHS